MKKAFREKLLRKRINQPLFLKRRRDKNIINNIQELDEFRSAKHILFYQPIFGEVEITNIFLQHKDKKEFYLPRVINHSKSLTIHKIESLEDLEQGSFGILEPKNNQAKIQPEQLDLILIPGVAFAPNGHRIGYGHGFFDKFLKKTNCPKIGIAYEFQIVKNIQAESHDVPVNKIITNKRVITIQSTNHSKS